MFLAINNVRYRNVNEMKPHMIDEVLCIDFSDTSQCIVMKPSEYYFRVYVNGSIVQIENLFHVYKLLCDLKYGRCVSLILNYIRNGDLGMYRRFIYSC